MSNQAIFLAFTLLGGVLARPISPLARREVPQEHSHEEFLRTVNIFLKQDNPENIQDAVFGLLGNAAAAEGQGSIVDTDCLQQATADRAFTNAKIAADIPGMTAALVFRTLERNTGQVGLASVSCASVEAVNPEIAALSQHQDPASENAAEVNKAITLELAKQIVAVGGNPEDALRSGTFAPGDVNDPTAAGNTCNDAEDPVGCIFTLGLLVEDASADEIQAAVAEVADAGVADAEAAEAVQCAAPPAEAAHGASPVHEAATPPLHEAEVAAPVHDVAAPVHEVEVVAPPVHEADVAAPVHEAEVAAPAHEIEVAAPVHEVEEAAPVKEAEVVEAAPVHEVEEATPVHEVEEAAPVHEAEVVEEVAPVHEAEAVEEAAPVHEVEVVEEAAPVHEVEEAAPVHEAEVVAPEAEAVH